MTQIVKEVKGHKYIYDMSWDPEKKKQVWKYIGKAKDTEVFDPEKLIDDIYKVTKKDSRIRVPKKVGHFRNVVEKVIEGHKGYW